MVDSSVQRGNYFECDHLKEVLLYGGNLARDNKKFTFKISKEVGTLFFRQFIHLCN